MKSTITENKLLITMAMFMKMNCLANLDCLAFSSFLALLVLVAFAAEAADEAVVNTDVAIEKSFGVTLDVFAGLLTDVDSKMFALSRLCLVTFNLDTIFRIIEKITEAPIVILILWTANSLYMAKRRMDNALKYRRMLHICSLM
ncbi:hypothetical protein BpHYR1_018229 [Brachionus plicatilis]|uniref:Uncharacterized protein n=1 Tax=Brachionus plicatilis TaxID=10195 RepID=A0A3M7QWM8_BRAPC|nr:hypothetical protein BpHYR1_018229 [Brachionus plicatilis]